MEALKTRVRQRSGEAGVHEDKGALAAYIEREKAWFRDKNRACVQAETELHPAKGSGPVLSEEANQHDLQERQSCGG